MTPRDTIPVGPPAVIVAGQAKLALATSLAAVSRAFDALQTAVLEYDATAQGIARQLDATATPEGSTP